MTVSLNIRFKHWMLAGTSVLALVVTGLVLVTVFGKFSKAAEENAKAQFLSVTRHASAELATQFGNVAQWVSTLSNAVPETFVRQGKINRNDLISPFMASLASDLEIDSHYFGLSNEEYLQVIGVRAKQKTIAALNAPPDTYFAVRRIALDGEGGKRTEHWQFFDETRKLLGNRAADAVLFPTSRPWFTGAFESGRIFVTPPYAFSGTGTMGLSFSSPLPKGLGVVGTNMNLGAINDFLAGLPLTPNAAIMIIDDRDRVLAFHGRGKFFEDMKLPTQSLLGQLKPSVLKSLISDGVRDEPKILALDEANPHRLYIIAGRIIEPVNSIRFKVVAMAPVLDFIGPLERAKTDALLVSGLVLLLLFVLSILGSRQVVAALTQLVKNSERTRDFDFADEPLRPKSFLYEINKLSDAQAEMHRAVKKRAAELKLAQEKLSRLVENGLLLSAERDRQKLIRHILFGSREIAHCQACTLYLKTEQNTLRFAMRTSEDQLPDFEVPLHHPETGEPMVGYVSSYVALKNEPVLIDDVYSETRFDLSGTKRFSERTGLRAVSLLTVPLSPRSDEVVGVLQLMNALDAQTGAVIPFPRELVRYVEALAAQSAVALENHNLLASQKELMDSMIKILAGAIDAKSRYTGSHCRRVPELACMLAEVAGETQTGSLADFSFKTEDEWREFRIAAWLHDCGKVTTPEHVIDKATKLETIYNRIHEIRTRFEVLLRDAQIARLRAVLAGVPEARADAAYRACQQELIEDFAFVAECNIGSESMAPGCIERLRQIGARTWHRHFDNRLGLSAVELSRFEKIPAPPLPATETLLSDQPWHLVPRNNTDILEPKYGFQVEVPQYLYDFGELHNLAVQHGTLSKEERFKINEHIIQTILMLESMPFPKNLRRVPEYAGEHHETLLGNGYPRKKTPEQLSIPSRIMAIADVFEALTADDRPYKKAIKLSEAVRILYGYKKANLIDPDLFDLFLASGVYRRYAERFLSAEQIDDVDVSAFRH